jgi:hypothetical protein
MEGTKLVKKIRDLNPIGIRTNGRPKNRRRDEVINGTQKFKMRNWIQLLKGRKAWNNLV